MVVLRNSNIHITQPVDVALVFQGLLRLEDTIDRDKEHFYDEMVMLDSMPDDVKESLDLKDASPGASAQQV